MALAHKKRCDLIKITIGDHVGDDVLRATTVGASRYGHGDNRIQWPTKRYSVYYADDAEAAARHGGAGAARAWAGARARWASRRALPSTLANYATDRGHSRPPPRTRRL
ncbi:hypothetical protein EVAR_21615_1 [Eumeta japonica]|uniref:Uncharacterized protein n=1 Tax=Eumeta variegata TaxID=151549 RepID=A0A4C1UYT8_EUMVA|nr:hypothetical protein EVAR_21615_1 [Eumeta japonica]